MTGWPWRWLTRLALLALVLRPGPASADAPIWCHRVQPGDTLWRIAARHDTTLARLRDLNGLDQPDVLSVGRLLRLPTLWRLQSGTLAFDGPSLPARAGDLRKENREADRQNLSRMQNLRMARRFIRAGLLVPVETATRTWWLETVPKPLRVARPWTRTFIEQLTRAFHTFFGGRLKITSLTRTIPVQRALRHRNGNAAPTRGPFRSTHLTGASVDISKRLLDENQVSWLRLVLHRLEKRRLLHATEEFQEPHFHVMVFRRYRTYARTLPSPILIGGC